MPQRALLWGSTPAERSPDDDNGPELAWKIVEPCAVDCGHPVHAFSVPTGARHLAWFPAGSPAVQALVDGEGEPLASRSLYGDDDLRTATEAMRQRLQQRFVERGMGEFMAEQFAALFNIRIASVVIEWLSEANRAGLSAAADAVRMQWSDDPATTRHNDRIADFLDERARAEHHDGR